MRKSVVAGVVGGVIASGVAAGVSTEAHAQNAVQWRIENGGNGHWYRTISSTATWSIARAACEANGGHLATLTTAEETHFVSNLAISPHTWIGGLQDTADSSYREPAGAWKWVTEEPLQFQAWGASEPNDYPPGGENALTIWFASPIWADYPNEWPCPYIIEWSADCNADGIVDYGQILAGELDDTNANNIPDCCEQGVECGCAADIDGNSIVNAIDLAIVIGYWGTDGGKEYARADIDGSGEIDGADLATLLGSWGPCE